MKIKSLLGVLLVLAMATGCTQPSQYSQKSTDSGSSGPSGSSGSSSSTATLLEDCQAYQAEISSTKYDVFLEQEWLAVTSGGTTTFESSDFSELWTEIQTGDFPTWDDVYYVVWNLCAYGADFELSTTTDEDEYYFPSAFSVKEGMVVALAYYCDNPDGSALSESSWTVTSPVAVNGFFSVYGVFVNQGIATFDMDVSIPGESYITPADSVAEDMLDSYGCSWPMKILVSD